MTNYRAPTNIRFPPDLHADIKKLAESRDVTFTQIVIEACYQYIDGVIPGLCPSCHTQNLADSQYCQTCGEPITGDESLRDHIKRLEMRIEQLERMVQVGKIAYENKELILRHKDEKIS